MLSHVLAMSQCWMSLPGYSDPTGNTVRDYCWSVSYGEWLLPGLRPWFLGGPSSLCRQVDLIGPTPWKHGCWWQNHTDAPWVLGPHVTNNDRLCDSKAINRTRLEEPCKDGKLLALDFPWIAGNRKKQPLISLNYMMMSISYVAKWLRISSKIRGAWTLNSSEHITQCTHETQGWQQSR